MRRCEQQSTCPHPPPFACSGGIHQKTAMTGGATAHGWPDAGALERLVSECVAQGLPVEGGSADAGAGSGGGSGAGGSTPSPPPTIDLMAI